MSLLVTDLEVSSGTFKVHVDRLEVRPGEIGAVIGQSGSGKSTLLQGVAGFAETGSGSIAWNGRELRQLPPEKRRAALVFQGGALFPHLTVSENVQFSLRLQGLSRARCRELARNWLIRLGIDGLADRKPSEISGGQAQRVALARGLAAQFPILLLDEPFSALDISTRQEARSLVRRLVTESSVAALLVTHDRADVLEVADRVFELRDGAIVWQGTAAEYRLWGSN